MAFLVVVCFCFLRRLALKGWNFSRTWICTNIKPGLKASYQAADHTWASLKLRTMKEITNISSLNALLISRKTNNFPPIILKQFIEELKALPFHFSVQLDEITTLSNVSASGICLKSNCWLYQRKILILWKVFFINLVNFIGIGALKHCLSGGFVKEWEQERKFSVLRFQRRRC